MLAPLVRDMMAAELPVLEANGLSPKLTAYDAKGQALTGQVLVRTNGVNTVQFTNLAPNQAIQKEFKLYAGPKENRRLERIALQLKNEIDIVMGYTGFFGWFSKALLWSMNGLHARCAAL